MSVTVTITMSDDDDLRYIDGACNVYDRLEFLENGNPNPVTKKQFALDVLENFIKKLAMKSECNLAADTARENIISGFTFDIQVSSK